MEKPEIHITANAGLIGVATKKDFDQAVAEHYGFVRRTMLFTNTPRLEFESWVTGDIQQLLELKNHCEVIAYGQILVPFSTEIWSLQEQKIKFQAISLAEAYKLIFMGRRQPPDQKPA